MFTIGQVAKKFSVSRSTLLYYDTIGLLKPSGRSDANYRLYSEADLHKMTKIALYRDAGLPLESIAGLLEGNTDELHRALEQRLQTISGEIGKLREQQAVIARILENEKAVIHAGLMTKDVWVALLAAAGLDEAGMHRWHVEFEKMSPAAHQEFLQSIGIGQAEIAQIRDWSRNDLDSGDLD
ncbi:MAG: MerR family transcriptional regulator [Chromatiales bacterium]